MAKIFTPVNQLRLTNVAVVRMKRNGKRFEVACYKNKVVSWRNGTENDINEVLQMSKIFTNVSKGELAKKEDILAAFGTSDELEICKQIIEKGELQISEKERDVHLESTYKEVASVIADLCVNPDTKRPYPISFIERSLRDIHFSVKPNKSAKQQALEVIPKLQQHLNIDRAKMRIRITVPSDLVEPVKSSLVSVLSKVSELTEGDDVELVGLIAPGDFRRVEQLVTRNSKGSGSVEIINQKELDESEDTGVFA